MHRGAHSGARGTKSEREGERDNVRRRSSCMSLIVFVPIFCRNGRNGLMRGRGISN